MRSWPKMVRRLRSPFGSWKREARSRRSFTTVRSRAGLRRPGSKARPSSTCSFPRQMGGSQVCCWGSARSALRRSRAVRPSCSSASSRRRCRRAPIGSKARWAIRPSPRSPGDWGPTVTCATRAPMVQDRRNFASPPTLIAPRSSTRSTRCGRAATSSTHRHPTWARRSSRRACVHWPRATVRP